MTPFTAADRIANMERSMQTLMRELKAQNIRVRMCEQIISRQEAELDTLRDFKETAHTLIVAAIDRIFADHAASKTVLEASVELINRSPEKMRRGQ